MIRTSSIRLTAEISALLAELDSFKKSWNQSDTLTQEDMAVLRHTATVESIGASTRIEGSKLTDRAVDDLLFHAPAKPLLTRDAQEAASYAEALDVILRHWRDIPLDEESIKELHRSVMIYCARDQHHRGEYKKTENHVEAFGRDRRKLGITFKTAPAAETPRLMKELTAWSRKAFADKKLHPLIASAVFIVVFLEIHPFQDGHGRLSRLMTTLLLLRHGYAHAPYSSLENIIERSRKDYYDALRQTQKTIRTAKPDWQPWILYFLKTLQKQKRRLENKVARERRGALSHVPVLSAAIIDITQTRGHA